MGKAKKSTKKFNKSNLKDELKTRRKHKQIKAKNAKKEAKKSNKVDKPIKKSDKGTLGYIKVAGSESNPSSKDIFETLDEEELEFTDSEHEESEEDEMEDIEEMGDAEEASSEVEEEEMDGNQESEADSEIEEEDSLEEDIEKEEAEHIKQLEKLKEKDPEFYKFLEQNDKDVLEFGKEEYEEEIDQEIEGEIEEEINDEERDDNFRTGSTTLSIKQIDSWEKELNNTKSLNLAKELILAFNDGAHINDQDKEEYNAKYTINSDKVFNKLMVVSMKSLPNFFNHHLKTKKINILPSQSPKWKKMQVLVKSYIGSIIHILSQITEQDMIRFMLERTQDLLRYIACFPKLLKSLLKIWIELFSTSSENNIQLLSFSLIRKLSILSPYALDLSLKGVYSAYIRNSKSINGYTYLRLNVMRSCGIELFGHNFDKSYQLAFTSIRQLAVHLRNSINTKTKESYTLIYNWQFITSIIFWSQVLSTYCNKDIESEHGESPLRPLIYPLTQVTLGVIRLIPSPKYFPLRLHCIKALLAISQKTSVYIPISPYIIEMLESSEFQRRPNNSTVKPFNLDFHLKAPKEHLGTKVYQDMLSEEINEYLLAHLASISNSIAFPEATLPIMHYLKKFKKNSKNMKINKFLELILTKIDATNIIIQKKRSQLDFAPSNIDKMKAFVDSISAEETPLGQYYTKLLHSKAQKKALVDDVEDSE